MNGWMRMRMRRRGYYVSYFQKHFHNQSNSAQNQLTVLGWPCPGVEALYTPCGKVWLFAPKRLLPDMLFDNMRDLYVREICVHVHVQYGSDISRSMIRNTKRAD